MALPGRTLLALFLIVLGAVLLGAGWPLFLEEPSLMAAPLLPLLGGPVTATPTEPASTATPTTEGEPTASPTGTEPVPLPSDTPGPSITPTPGLGCRPPY